MKSIENADKIVVLENGRVESQGKHEELLQKSKVYKNLMEKTKWQKNLYIERTKNETKHERTVVDQEAIVFNVSIIYTSSNWHGGYRSISTYGWNICWTNNW